MALQCSSHYFLSIPWVRKYLNMMHQMQACLSIADIQKFSIRSIHCTYIDFKIQKATTTCHFICYLFKRISKPVSHHNKTRVTRRTYFGLQKISFFKALDEQRTIVGIEMYALGKLAYWRLGSYQKSIFKQCPPIISSANSHSGSKFRAEGCRWARENNSR